VDPGEACPGPTGDITQYQISLHTGSVMATENVNIARCTAGRCSHTFELPSNPPSSYDSVSVAAENVVGVGAARTCTTQTISECCYYIFSLVIRLPCHKVGGTRYNITSMMSRVVMTRWTNSLVCGYAEIEWVRLVVVLNSTTLNHAST